MLTVSYRLWPVDLWFGLLSRLQRVVVRVKFNTGWVSAHASDGRQILKALDNDAEAMLVRLPRHVIAGLTCSPLAVVGTAGQSSHLSHSGGL